MPFGAGRWSWQTPRSSVTPVSQGAAWKVLVRYLPGSGLPAMLSKKRISWNTSLASLSWLQESLQSATTVLRTGTVQCKRSEACRSDPCEECARVSSASSPCSLLQRIQSQDAILRPYLSPFSRRMLRLAGLRAVAASLCSCGMASTVVLKHRRDDGRHASRPLLPALEGAQLD